MLLSTHPNIICHPQNLTTCQLYTYVACGTCIQIQLLLHIHAKEVKQSVLSVCQHKNSQIWRSRRYSNMQVSLQCREGGKMYTFQTPEMGQQCYKIVFLLAMPFDHTELCHVLPQHAGYVCSRELQFCVLVPAQKSNHAQIVATPKWALKKISLRKYCNSKIPCKSVNTILSLELMYINFYTLLIVLTNKPLVLLAQLLIILYGYDCTLPSPS